jgi:hypothetical protein
MWVSQKKWDEMQRRVNALERWRDCHGTFHIYDPDDDYPSSIVSLSVASVIYKILEHLGLKLEHVDGREATVKISSSAAAEDRPA